MTTDPSTTNALDALPDETLIEATGTYIDDGGFTKCWARPVPRFISGDDGARVWEVLVFGSELPHSLTTADRIAHARVLYTIEEDTMTDQPQTFTTEESVIPPEVARGSEEAYRAWTRERAEEGR